jgi:hypothetical protein
VRNRARAAMPIHKKALISVVFGVALLHKTLHKN